MVFSSAPLFLDPPNWHHQQPASNDETSQRAPQVMPAAGVPAAEGQLKCPRCDSGNTKFCYFNNYSLTQPRHFCKTCRRYWTRGGSLRNVPVGGGCRRNKRKRATSTRRPRSPPAELQAPRAPPAEFMAPPQAPFSFMTSLQGLMTSSQLGVGSNLFGGFGPSSSSMLYPFQNNNMDGNGMMETASFGKGLLGFPHHHQQQLPVKMEESGGSRANLLSKQFLADVDVGMSQQQQQMTWSSAAAGSSGGLWTDLSRI